MDATVKKIIRGSLEDAMNSAMIYVEHDLFVESQTDLEFTIKVSKVSPFDMNVECLVDSEHSISNTTVVI